MQDYYGKTRAQSVQDVEWIREAAERGWVVVTANPRIARVEHEIGLICELGVNVFCLGNPNQNRELRALIVGRHYLTIRRRWRRSGPSFWRLYPHETRKDIA